MWKKLLFVSTLAIALSATVVWSRPAAPPTCGNPAVRLFHDYTYLIGSADFSDPDGDPESGSSCRWLVNGTLSIPEPVAEGLLLHFDDSVAGANGESPTLSQNPAYATGKWGTLCFCSRKYRVFCVCTAVVVLASARHTSHRTSLSTAR